MKLTKEQQEVFSYIEEVFLKNKDALLFLRFDTNNNCVEFLNNPTFNKNVKNKEEIRELFRWIDNNFTDSDNRIFCKDVIKPFLISKGILRLPRKDEIYYFNIYFENNGMNNLSISIYDYTTNYDFTKFVYRMKIASIDKEIYIKYDKLEYISKKFPELRVNVLKEQEKRLELSVKKASEELKKFLICIEENLPEEEKLAFKIKE